MFSSCMSTLQVLSSRLNWPACRFGPMLIGVFLNMILYGVRPNKDFVLLAWQKSLQILLNQASCLTSLSVHFLIASSSWTDILLFQNIRLVGYLAHQSSSFDNRDIWHRDSLWIRLFVAYLFVMETANSVIDIAMMYQPLIAEYGASVHDYANIVLTWEALVGTEKAVQHFPTRAWI